MRPYLVVCFDAGNVKLELPAFKITIKKTNDLLTIRRVMENKDQHARKKMYVLRGILSYEM